MCCRHIVYIYIIIYIYNYIYIYNNYNIIIILYYAIDLRVTSPLNSDTLQVVCVTPSSAAMQAEQRKHHSNDAKCGELGWVCIPLVVESYGSWGPEAQRSLSRLAGRL